RRDGPADELFERDEVVDGLVPIDRADGLPDGVAPPPRIAIRADGQAHRRPRILRVWDVDLEGGLRFQRHAHVAGDAGDFTGRAIRADRAADDEAAAHGIAVRPQRAGAIL